MLDMRDLSINERVARCRKMQGKRQEDMANALDMKLSTYSQMERAGEIKVARLMDIADILDITPDLLFYGVEEREQVKTVDIETKEETATAFEQPISDMTIKSIAEPKKSAEYSREEKNHFDIVHNLPKKHKKEVFEYIQEVYKQIKYKNK